MRIVLIINQLGIGGAERLVVDEANELYRRGVPFTLVTLKPERGNSYLSDCKFPTSDFVCIPFGSLFDYRGWVALVGLLRAKKPDAVITHLWFSNTIGRIAAAVARVPRVVSFEHNVYDSVKTRKQFFIDWALQRYSKRIIAVSDAVRDSLVRHGIDTRRITILANGIDLSRYQDATPSDIRTEMKLGNAFLFLYVGRLIYQKAVDVLLNAFVSVEHAHLLIAGDGIDRAVLEGQAHDLGLDGRVSFLGIRADIPNLMKAADCFVLPSRHEGMPIVVIEALASGAAVIVSDFSSAREIIQHEVSGLIVQRENIAALTSVMGQVMNDGALCRTLRKNAPLSSARFTIQVHCDALLQYISA